ncbi:MAG: hypothetical protein AVDCRST_MAG18-2641, partial [uncultured Thermomicrobiales bacterium]
GQSWRYPRGGGGDVWHTTGRFRARAAPLAATLRSLPRLYPGRRLRRPDRPRSRSWHRRVAPTPSRHRRRGGRGLAHAPTLGGPRRRDGDVLAHSRDL